MNRDLAYLFDIAQASRRALEVVRATEDIPDLLKFVERLLDENPPPQSGDQR